MLYNLLSMQSIIKVENLGKRYNIGERQSYYSLRDTIAGFFDRKRRKGKGDFWALKDINFEIKKGESIGIIGRNGAGKSTLLKILSQITPPTTGKITMRGRVASLLEVGTGFNPELTGRENIFLNGAILGMSRAEIKKKFDEIVAFSEVEKFLDMPVKHYSSGMYMRLAFAVAAHLESEILIIDEVLAVGDAQFQKKCLGKMGDVAKKEGRTVLFVSHNMGAVLSLCDKSIWLEKGLIKRIGDTNKIVNQYLSNSDNKNIDVKDFFKNKDTIREGTGKMKFSNISFHSFNNFSNGNIIRSGDDIEIRIEIDFKEGISELNDVNIALSIDDSWGNRLVNLSSNYTNQDIEILRKDNKISIFIKKTPLTPGKYYLTLFSSVGGEISDWLQKFMSIDIEEGNFYGTGKLPVNQGSFLVDYTYKIK